jgi:hypothetical protein
LVLRVEDVSSAPTVAPATIAHVFVTENGDPDRKPRSFARVLDSLANASPDIALLKFCYVDFRADTDVEALFHRYQAAIAEYRARHPATTFVHVTAPLTTVEGGVKALVKRWSGRVPFGLAENARREEFNGLLRKAYQGREPLFDLARVESTRPDGRRETVDWNGRAVPALADAYALDDGHLNEAGQDRAARELLAVLAAVPLQATRP